VNVGRFNEEPFLQAFELWLGHVADLLRVRAHRVQNGLFSAPSIIL